VRSFILLLVATVIVAASVPAFGTEDIAGKTAAKMKSDLVIESGPFKPFIGFDYGWSSPSFDDLDSDFASLGLAELKIGYVSDDLLIHDLISFDPYRFGTLAEAGLRVHLTDRFSLTGGYEGAVILPRTVFWPWLGSIAIYTGVQGGLDTFSAKIIEASPKAGPVIAWVLKTGVAAGYYYLLKDDMNWPFNYETPVMVGSFKVGANVKF
jgi:hypothetical protein